MLIADLTAERASMLALAFSMKDGSAAISSFAALVMTEASTWLIFMPAARISFFTTSLRQTTGFGHHIRSDLVAVGVLGTTTGLGDLASLEIGKILLGDLEGGSLRFGELFSLKVLGEDFGHTSIQEASRPFWSTNW